MCLTTILDFYEEKLLGVVRVTEWVYEKPLLSLLMTVKNQKPLKSIGIWFRQGYSMRYWSLPVWLIPIKWLHKVG
jgi:hypothetical protein